MNICNPCLFYLPISIKSMLFVDNCFQFLLCHTILYSIKVYKQNLQFVFYQQKLGIFDLYSNKNIVHIYHYLVQTMNIGHSKLPGLTFQSDRIDDLQRNLGSSFISNPNSINNHRQIHYNRFQNQFNPQVINIGVLQQLQIKYDLNRNIQDVRELNNLVTNYLEYPNIQKALFHSECNRLGLFDLKKASAIDHVIKSTYEPDMQNNFFTTINQYFTNKQLQDLKFNKYKYIECQCGCKLMKQPKSLHIMTNLEFVQNIGVSIYLFFFTIKNLILLLTMMLLIFSSINIYFNLLSSKEYQSYHNTIQTNQNQISYQGFLAASIGSKILNKNTDLNKRTLLVQSLVGGLTIFWWGICFIFIKLKQRKYQQFLDYHEVSASDYTLAFLNVPSFFFANEGLASQLEYQLRRYCQSLGDAFPAFKESFPIQIQRLTIACPVDFQGFSIQSNKRLNKRIEFVSEAQKAKKKQLLQLVKLRMEHDDFPAEKNLQVRKRIYAKWQKIRKISQSENKTGFERKLQKKVKQELINILFEPTATLFVTFNKTFHKQFIQRLHSRQSSLLFNLPCCKQRQYFNFQLQNETYEVKIEPAPEPEDIKWENYFQSRLKRTLITSVTFTLTVVILCASFFAIYELNNLQYQYMDKVQATEKSRVRTLLSLAISIVLFVINQIVSRNYFSNPEISRVFVKLERHTSHTRQQISIGYKSIMAMLANSVIVPIVVNSIFKKNIYGIDGLADSVFYQSLINCILTPFIKIIINFAKFTLKKQYFKRPAWKLGENQKTLNQKLERDEFEVGQQYTSIVFMYLFACFYASLQPIVVLFTILGLIAMYWCQKFILFNQCKRPIKGNNEINTAIHFLVFLGPLTYVIGSYLWTKQASNLLINISNGLSLILSLVIIILPYREIVKKIRKNESKKEIVRRSSYEQDKHLFSNDYHQLNPLEQIINKPKYREFIREQVKKMQQSKRNGLQEDRKKQNNDNDKEEEDSEKQGQDLRFKKQQYNQALL